MNNSINALKTLVGVFLFFVSTTPRCLFAMIDFTPKPLLSEETEIRFNFLEKQFQAKRKTTRLGTPPPAIHQIPTTLDISDDTDPEEIPKDNLSDLQEHEAIMRRIAEDALSRQRQEILIQTLEEVESQKKFDSMKKTIITKTNFPVLLEDFAEEAIIKTSIQICLYLKQLLTEQSHASLASRETLYRIFESNQSIISVFKLTQEVCQRSTNSIECFYALAFMSRIKAIGKIQLTGSNLYRLFLTSLIMATKLCRDEKANFNEWCKISNDVSEASHSDVLIPKKLVKCEKAFLDAINFDHFETGINHQTTLNVSPEELLETIHTSEALFSTIPKQKGPRDFEGLLVILRN